MFLERRARLLQELDLLRSGLPSQRAVAMRKSPEALDDVVVALRVVEEALVVLAPGPRDHGAQATETFDRQPLQRGILRVLQRQVEERPRGGYETAIEVALDAIDGKA